MIGRAGRRRFGSVAVLALLGAGCRTLPTASPSVAITAVPEAAPGGARRLEPIAGRVTGAHATQQIVLYAKSGSWWVQPFAKQPYTPIQPDGTWKSTTHLGTDYAALLVEPNYVAPKTTDALPRPGGSVVAVASLPGRASAYLPPTPKTLLFSGYKWDVLQLDSDSGGVLHKNSGANAWVDGNGELHLRIAREGNDWTCGEVILSRSLGYGSYSFTVRPLTRLEPGSVLGLFTYDELEAGQNHREIDVELSQWGDPASKNAQFTIQPYYVPANVFRFQSPLEPLTYSFQWAPGIVQFQTSRHVLGQPPRLIAQHQFTSGIPSPGGERVHLNLYIYGKSRTIQQEPAEVVIEKFSYLP